jgi:[acyl-carrier-protein] S-malonyltransferase
MQKKIAWLFPGQGTQTVGMGHALAAASPAAREIFQRADAALGFELSRLCFEGPEHELTQTENAQPAILTASIAALAALRERVGELPRPLAAAGHSLGEYSALVAARAISFEDAVRLVRRRGQAMQQAVPEGQGAMAAVLGGDSATVLQLCDAARENDVLAPANYNCPGQIVIAGHSNAVERAEALAKERKLKAIRLKVSAPFHCRLMAPAARAVDEELARITVGPMDFPVVANYDAQPNDDAARTRMLLVHQVCGAVLWEQTIRWLGEHGMTHALEIGPGRVLSGLARKIDKSIEVVSVADPEGVSTVSTLLA